MNYYSSSYVRILAREKRCNRVSVTEMGNKESQRFSEIAKNSCVIKTVGTFINASNNAHLIKTILVDE